MKVINSELIEILKENFYLMDIIDDEDFEFVEPVNIGDDKYLISLVLSCPDEYQTHITFELDAKDYDTKFYDVDEYEVDDMGVVISISRPNGELISLSTENIWRELFYNKEKYNKD